MTHCCSPRREKSVTHVSTCYSNSIATSDCGNGADSRSQPFRPPRKQPAARSRRSGERGRPRLAVLVIRSRDAGRTARREQARADSRRGRHPGALVLIAPKRFECDQCTVDRRAVWRRFSSWWITHRHAIVWHLWTAIALSCTSPPNTARYLPFFLVILLSETLLGTL